jgi:hypothetical protein
MPSLPGITNPTGAYGLPIGTIGGSTFLTNDGVFIEMQNNAGAVEQYGALMILDTAAAGLNGLSVIDSTTAHDKTIFGVVSEYNNLTSTVPSSGGHGTVGAPGVANAAPCILQIRGVGRVLITGTVAVGAYLEQSATAATAQVITSGTAVTFTTANGTLGDFGTVVGFALEAQTAKDTFNTIRCRLLM